MKLEEVKGKIVDSLHWREYTVIGAGNITQVASLTQTSEEVIALQFLSLKVEGKTIFKILDEYEKQIR